MGVDTHVWQIAVRDFDPSLSKAKSLTPTIYARVGALFRDRFGDHSGWAHSMLFAAELPYLQSLLPSKLQVEIDNFRKTEKRRKVEIKEEKEEKKKSAPPQSTPKKRTKNTKQG